MIVVRMFFQVDIQLGGNGKQLGHSSVLVRWLMPRRILGRICEPDPMPTISAAVMIFKDILISLNICLCSEEIVLLCTVSLRKNHWCVEGCRSMGRVR